VPADGTIAALCPNEISARPASSGSSRTGSANCPPMQHIRFVSPREGEEAGVVMGVVHAAIVTNACPAEWGPLRAARLRTYLGFFQDRDLVHVCGLRAAAEVTTPSRG
jgi:hypothetical protein